MYCTQKVTEDIFWVGASDRRLSLFENAFPIPNGISYNSYLLMDEKTVLFDTVDHSVSRIFFENIEHVLNGKALDYLVINHMEPDHCSEVALLCQKHSELTLICNDKAQKMLSQFFADSELARITTIAEGDTLCTGKHTLQFFMAPMVHWPETMVTFDKTSGVLFSADAFGTFGAINGNLFCSGLDIEHDILPEARRYYCNIVGKYGVQVMALLNKAKQLDIKMLCPLHGPVWDSNISWYLHKYQNWATYTPEDNAVAICYASIYGNTENAASILAFELAALGIKNIKMYDVSAIHPSYIVAEAFRCSHLVFASVTYNSGIFSYMHTVLSELAAHNLQNRTVALIENGSWGVTVAKQMAAMLEGMKNITVLDGTVSIKSTLSTNQYDDLKSLAKQLAASM